METIAERRLLSKDLIRSKRRVAEHGEVFTPSWLVEDMLDLNGESDRVEARFLESACGSGNFLTRILQRKLAVVELKCRKGGFDNRHLSLVAVMSIYGIELLKDNIVECRKRMLEIFVNYLAIRATDELYRAASSVLLQNLVHGDALKMRTSDGRPIIFAEWEYLGKGKFRRRDFRFDILTQSPSLSSTVALRSHPDTNEVSTPAKVYEPMTVGEIAYAVSSSEQRKTL